MYSVLISIYKKKKAKPLIRLQILWVMGKFQKWLYIYVFLCYYNACKKNNIVLHTSIKEYLEVFICRYVTEIRVLLCKTIRRLIGIQVKSFKYLWRSHVFENSHIHLCHHNLNLNCILALRIGFFFLPLNYIMCRNSLNFRQAAVFSLKISFFYFFYQLLFIIYFF